MQLGGKLVGAGDATTSKANDQHSAANTRNGTARKVSRCGGPDGICEATPAGPLHGRTNRRALRHGGTPYGLDGACKETKRSDMMWLALLATP